MVLRVAVGVGLLAALVGCGREGGGDETQGAGGDTARVAASETPGRCGIVADPAHPDPERLLREYLERDAAGEFVRGGSSWFTGAVDCPRREMQAAPFFGIAASYRIDSLVVGDSTAAALVRWRRVGFVSGAGTSHAAFDAVPALATEIVRARRTPSGWRIVSPAPRGMVLYSAFPVREALGPAAHALVVQMAEQARRSPLPGT